MRDDQLEAWVLSVVDVVTAGQRVEDSRVELKAEWPTELDKAARRVAGQINAAGGSPALWIIGLIEGRGVVSFPPVDPAQWFGQFESYFDGLAPRTHVLNVPTKGGQVVALLFDSTRRPFVVKNPAHGQPGGGSVSLEVPWRDGTRVRTAMREDLIRLLVPDVELPTLELRGAGASVEIAGDESGRECLFWDASVQLYVTPRSGRQVVFPTHRAAMQLRMPGEKPIEFTKLRIGPRSFTRLSYEGRAKIQTSVDSLTVRATGTEAVLDGPGEVHVRGQYSEPAIPLLTAPPPVELVLTLRTADDDRPQEVTARLLGSPTLERIDEGKARKWVWRMTSFPAATGFESV